MIRYVNLIEYLPAFMREYEEFKQITNTENEELRNLNTLLKSTRDNQFIFNCDNEGIEKFEKILGIIPGTGDTLAVRTERIAIRFLNSTPYTMNSLKEKLIAICGEDGYTIKCTFSEYKIEIALTLGVKNTYFEVERLLKRLLPANLTLSLSILYNTWGYLESQNLTWEQIDVLNLTWEDLIEYQF